MKNKLLLILGFIIIANVNIFAQCSGCVVDTNCCTTPAKPFICPDTLPQGMANHYYDNDVTFYLPANFVDDGTGFNVSLNELVILSVSGLPYGLNWQTNSANNRYYPTSNPPTTEYGCAKICGTPLISGQYNITVFIRAYVTALGVSQTSEQSFNLPIEILADTSTSNNVFSITNTRACAPLTASFTVNNAVINSGIQYSWDFGNGASSNLISPPSITYTNAGVYPIVLTSTVDTLDYYINSITINSATCNDFFDGPDIKCKIYKGSTHLYSTTMTQNASLPITQTFSQINLDSSLYSIEVWDEGTGIGGDDHCGTVQFYGYNVGTHTLTDGSDLTVTFTVHHPIIINTASDTIRVMPTPEILAVNYFPWDSVCLGDSIILDVSTIGGEIFQWVGDTNAYFGANDSIFIAKYTSNPYVNVSNQWGCSVNSSVVPLTFVNNPAKPTFWTSAQNELSTNSTYDLQWYKNGQILAGETSQVLNITETANYQLLATATTGCYTWSDTVYVILDDTGIEDKKYMTNTNIYPNPSGGIFNINFESLEKTEILIRIIDLSSRELYSEKNIINIGKNSYTIDLNTISSGLYLLQLQADGYIQNHRIIIE